MIVGIICPFKGKINITIVIGDRPAQRDGFDDDTLAAVGSPGEDAQERPSPAVPIKKSVTPDYVICLEDGKKLKMLKRHLKTSYDMTPDEYRERWGLPADYPMVAPNYAKQRSRLARKIGLGTKGRRKS